MKKIFATAAILTISMLAATAGFADEGETEEPSNVAPAIIQAPSTPSPAEASPAVRPAPLPQPLPDATGTRSIREASLRTADSQVMEGSVVCVIPSGIMQPKSKVTVSDAAGNQVEFTVKVLAVIYDSSGTILSVDQLCQGDKVQVNYRTALCNIKEATSIKVIK
jgi:hypothetical protein